MQPLLILLAVVVGAILIVAVVLAWLVTARLRGLRQAFETMENLGAEGPLPARVHLRRCAQVGWTNPADAGVLTGNFAELGFQEAGLFTIDEIPVIRLAGFAAPEQSVYGLVYEHANVGVWTDLITLYQDGTGLTYTTTDKGRDLDQRPGHGKVCAPGTDLPALYRRLLAERPQRPLRAITVEGFAAAFEQAYADDIDWRNKRGGPTEDEIRAIGRESGLEMSDDEVAATRETLARQAAEGLQEALREEFLAAAVITAGEWEEIRDRVVFIHDLMTPDQLTEAFEEGLPDEYPEASQALLRAAENEPARAVFASVAATLPEGARFRSLGTVHRPVEADAYEAPAAPDD